MPNFGPNGVVYFLDLFKGLMMNKLNPSIQFWAQSTRGLQIAFMSFGSLTNVNSILIFVFYNFHYN